MLFLMCELVLLLDIRTFRKCLINAAVRRSIKLLQFEKKCPLSLGPALICLDIVQSLGISEDIIVRWLDGFAASSLVPILFPCLLASINTSSKPQFFNLIRLPVDSGYSEGTKKCVLLFIFCVN